ncbi:cytochrome P450 [Corynespora cassiicola Philippines]|uniref:Cytochrome P450 n=1 Tax=Corynespora cassiicola Philippines TaxID=1448308 RepID=A0A2T2NBQ0_CORCC|nr:cytochrome P450 [Corynespora cassiicola Philippines]
MHAIYLVYAVVALLATRTLYTLLRALFSPLRHIPGPFLARFTKAWYFYSIYNGRHEHDLIALHRKHAKPGEFYAPVIRIAPNMYSIKTPEKSVYSVSSKMPKNSWYEGWKHPSPDRWTLFTDRNIKRHAESRRLYSGIYAMSALVSYEKYVDDCTSVFRDRLREAADSGEAVNMGQWFQYYAFDVIGAITYGKRFGFLDRCKDLGNTIRALDGAMIYSTLVGVYSWAHPTLYAILEWFPASGAAGRTYLMRFAGNILAQRKAERAAREREGKPAREEKGEGDPEDFVDKMMDMQGDPKKGVTDYHVLALSLSNIFAGSDTTAVSLSAVLYHLLRTPAAMDKLRQEVDRFAEASGGEERVPFKASQEMKYLQACIKEALRLHPATGLPLWRVVNGDGAELCGQYFKAGTEVGTNTWIAHYNEEIWGPDAKVYKPERWTDAAEEGGERLKTMEASYLPFGLGSRTCLGRHISHLEMCKLLPYIIRSFDFELEHPERSWSTHNLWFVKPTDFRVHVRVRAGTV